ncbi:unnamed protein product [Rotaria magnacalcarata]|uniref:Uncharacterized protein n=3 Tax=Rotaria magnacalcarata TaxID=392030 RepID=A0A816CTT3_9BILA|nr:unnamed protein product [Rotaria magnacalcarata]
MEQNIWEMHYATTRYNIVFYLFSSLLTWIFAQKLIALDLRGNNIGSHGAQHLAKALINNKILSIMNLEMNQIRNEGIKYLSDALYENTTLTTLNLSSNEIDDDGALYLANALVNNRTLTKLDLIQNQIGDEGAHYFANALTKNTVKQAPLSNLAIHHSEFSIRH